MKVFVAALALSSVYRIASAAIVVTLMAAPSYAQAPAPQTQKPAAPAVQAPAQPAPPIPRFQDGLKYGYVQIQLIAANSNQGKAFNAKVQALQEQKIKELQDRNKALQAAQEKLEKGAGVMNDQARGQLQMDIERQQRDIQRFTEDAQQEVTALTQQLQQDFERVLTPVIDRIAKEKQVHFIFNAQESGLVWADPSLDLTGDIIKALDSGAPAASTAKPAPAPAAK